MRSINHRSRYLILKVKHISKSFGANVVLRDISFSLKEGEFKSIIGPNGAGKTTLYNLISGVLKPDGGTVLLRGEDITRMPSHKIAQMGLSRSFQITNLFPNLTCRENIRIAIQAKGLGNYNIFRPYTYHKSYLEKAEEVIDMVKLNGKGDILAKNLSHAEKRKLELGILLGLGGDLILLDEPTAGMSIEEVPEMISIIEEIRKTQNKSILLIEHKIGIILSISDSIAVMQNGVFIADETPAEIQLNSKVQDAYFGGGIVNGK